MNPQQRVRNLLAEKGVERTPAEIERLFKHLYMVYHHTIEVRTGDKWDPEKIADAFAKKLARIERLV